jgi:transcriptional regulator of acetoin/glycerol metabolism
VRVDFRLIAATDRRLLDLVAEAAPARHDSGGLAALDAPFRDGSAPSRYGLANLLDERGELRRFAASKEEVIRFALAHCRGRMSEVARRLGIGRSTLYRKLKDCGTGAEDAPAA